MRRVVVLAGGALLAGAGLFMSSGAGPAPRASIEGAALESGTSRPEMGRAQAAAQQKASSAALDLDLTRISLVGEHYEAPTRDGRTARLTLDPELQKLAEKLLNESRAPRGAIVAMAPDGRVLAFAGRRTDEPKGGKEGTFDPSLVTTVWAPAASIFKLVTASALITHGYDPDQKVCYHGGVRSVMESNLVDHKRDSRCETLGYGVAHSNNAILGKLAYQKLDPALLDRHARDLGWASALPASSLGTSATCGELALPEEKNLTFAKAAAGFTGSRLSVLGGAVLAATFAADGQQPAPYLVEAIDGESITPPRGNRVIAPEVAQKVAEMMVGTCENGSAAKTFRKKKKVSVAGKTGTLTTHTPFYMENSWFVGFAPVDEPEVVVSVLLGNPESWHLRGHEAAKRMIDRAMQRAEDRDTSR